MAGQRGGRGAMEARTSAPRSPSLHTTRMASDLSMGSQRAWLSMLPIEATAAQLAVRYRTVA